MIEPSPLPSSIRLWHARFLACASECAIVPSVSISRSLAPRQAYAAYLQTPEWRRRREAALKFAEGRCSLCPEKRFLDVHHKSYENLGDEPLWDLIVLCRRCHQRHHDSFEPLEAMEPTGFELKRWWEGLTPSGKRKLQERLPRVVVRA